MACVWTAPQVFAHRRTLDLAVSKTSPCATASAKLVREGVGVAAVMIVTHLQLLVVSSPAVMSFSLSRRNLPMSDVID